MNELTETQFNNLVTAIYNKLCESDEIDMDGMIEAKSEANRLVIEWANNNNINLNL